MKPAVPPQGLASVSDDGPFHRVTSAVLAALTSLSARGIAPAAAAEEIAKLAALHKPFELDLLWHEESFDHSYQYDVIIRAPEGDAVSIGFCPDRRIPWPLRGAQRWTEFYLVRINGNAIKANEAFAFLDFLWEDARAVARIVDTELIKAELINHPVVTTPEEVQGALEGFRRTRKLLTPAQTHRWMESYGLSHDSFERLGRQVVRFDKLRARVAAGQVEPYFDAHREQFDRLLTVEVCLPGAQTGSGIADQLRGPEVDLTAIGARLNEIGGGAASLSLRWQRRHQCRPGLSTDGPLIEPHGAGGRRVTRLLRTEPAILDEEVRREITTRIFGGWLARRRESATIDWFWGRPGLFQWEPLQEP